jgi:serine/threonine-protein kinase
VSEETRLGPFVVERELGRGGMGVVYAARYQGRAVALKVSIDDLPERDRKHFLAEAELLSRISHPAVIEILDSGALDDGRPYLVMPLLAGETLAARLARGRLDVDLALRLFAQLVGAVAALHDAGIVHRDIKPENVMYLEEEERLVLLDFGIAREIGRPASTTTRMNLVRGTPGCMAPERFFGVRASASSDVYELGVVLYAMVVGTLPWDEPTDPEARLRPRHPSELGVDLPVGLGHILLEALSTRPDRRPSARELAVRVRAVEGAPLTPNPHARTTVALPGAAREMPQGPTPTVPAIPLMESPPPRARSIAPPSDEGRGRPGPSPRWITGAVALTAMALGSSILARSRRAGVPVSWARAGLGTHVLAASRSLGPESTDDFAALVPAGSPATEPSTEPVTPPAPSASTNVGPARSPAASASVTATTAAPGMPWCTKMVELYCAPTARKLPDGDARCAARRAELVRMKDLPDSTRARGEAGCREAIPVLEKSLRTPQSSEAGADMPFCKRVVAAYCSPEVKNSYGGDSLCSQAQRGWYGAYLTADPAVRVSQNEKCAQALPAVIQAMQQHVQTLGPGTAASARLTAAAQRATQGAVPGATATGAPPVTAPGGVRP